MMPVLDYLWTKSVPTYRNKPMVQRQHIIFQRVRQE